MNFDREMSRLNKNQREAVEATEGPVLVIAGPGTGKTQLLSMRAANILRNTDTEPRNILCLTFTNKAATNMRERLLNILGDSGREIQVRTFHSFAAEIMNQFSSYFWRGASLQIVPDALQAKIVQDILRKLPGDNPLGARFGDTFTAQTDVNNAMNRAKEAGLSPEKLKALVELNLAYIETIEDRFVEITGKPLSAKILGELQSQIHGLPAQGLGEDLFPFQGLDEVVKSSLDRAVELDQGTDKTKHVGLWKKRYLQIKNKSHGMIDERKRNEWWLYLADVYSSYKKDMEKRGHYDYGDMLVEVLSKLDSNPDLLTRVQENYHYVMVDEFQDSNAAQLRLSHLVSSNPDDSRRPNIMAVGDDDQSIFGFNGAELSSMLFFDKNYDNTKKIVLTENYRSSQKILNISKLVIKQAEERLLDHNPELSKNLIAKNPPKTSGNIIHLSYPSREHQLSGVARRVLKEHKSTGSMAVLARNHESLRQLASLLLGLGVPLRYEQQSNILGYEAIEQIVLLARIVLAIQKGEKDKVDAYLAASLRHPMWNLDAKELWGFVLNIRSNQSWLDGLMESNSPDLQVVAKWFLWLSTVSEYEPLPLVMEYLIGLREGEHITSPIRQYFTSEKPINSDYLQALSGIRLLRELVNEFTDTTTPKLKDFVDLITISEQSKSGVTDESVFVTSDRAVELATVYKAKGLEFDSVYIIDAVEKYWQPKKAGRKPPANLPLGARGEHMDDYVRLLYVAMTRAKRNITFSSYYSDEKGQDILPTPLIYTVLPPKKLKLSECEEPITVLEENIRWPHLDIADERLLLKGKVEDFSINVSNLINFLDVTNGGPSYFLERNLLHLPELKTPALAFGSAIHKALEVAGLQSNEGNLTLKTVLSAFKSALSVEHVSEYDEKRLLAQGEKTLTDLFENYKYEIPSQSSFEQKITNIRLKNAIIDGKLDRVDKNGKNLSIIDYKTGSALSNLNSKAKSFELKAWKHRTQLIFYALLAKYHPGLNIYNEVEGKMVYVQAKSQSQLSRSYTPSQQEITRLEQVVEAVWLRVMNLDLPDTSKYSQDYDGIIKFEEDLLKIKN